MLLPLLICVQRNLPKFGSLLKNVFQNTRTFQRKFTTSSCARSYQTAAPPDLVLFSRGERGAVDPDLAKEGRLPLGCCVVNGGRSTKRFWNAQTDRPRISLAHDSLHYSDISVDTFIHLYT